MSTRLHHLRKVKTKECTQCGGLMSLETATVDTGSTPDTHTQYETEYWLCGSCGAEDDYIP